MSSIVKKAQTSFTPKFKKNVNRKRQRTSDADTLVTPQTTQQSQEDSIPDAASPDKQAPSVTPEPSQVSFYSSSKSDKVAEEDVDPHDATRKISISEEVITNEGEEDEEDYGDNDIFKKPQEDLTRRKSSMSQRRLSGISIRKSGSRSASISISVTPRGSFGEYNDKMPAPIPIEIPVTKNKRRRSSVIKPSKRVSISDGRSKSVGEGGEVRDIEEEDEDDANEEMLLVDGVETRDTVVEYNVDDEISRDELYEHGEYLIFAVNPITSILSQFRTGPLEGKLEGHDDRDYPLAPETVSMKISSIKQIPKHLRKRNIGSLVNIKIDSEKMTMEDICNPSLPVGVLSHNFQLVQEAKKRTLEAQAFRRNARRYAKLNQISYEKAIEILEKQARKAEQENGTVSKKEEDTEQGVKPDPATELPSIRQTTGLKLNVNPSGKIDIDAESTVVQRGAQDLGDRQREETNPFEKPVISNTYSKRKYTDKWEPNEEQKFYDAISVWGTDFSIISTLFPHRTRKQIKAKFNNEEKRRPELVDMALNRHGKVDLEKFAAETRMKLETKAHFEEAQRQIRVENDAQKKEILKERERAMLEDAEKNRRKEIERKSGQRQPIQRLSRTKQLRQNEEVVGTLEKK
ncbi:hypothetical protein PSN45_003503 [Yamadazyma tenuis]|uniref:Transcription factor IIIB, Bdp1 subunit n=1 Tax=Candida tenuis (strain ATCC 10573 / BCRC 21748 / CBS 615 / JCM 9827 / NBRC 10315 / NRRL Y-1498 / VKM Y-70) TaxID=590646 RepID=G3AXX1_CANTC|nr:transcription factor IIIB, Bdp1 subunit [Yamadazyma tenuis ATCC 10573]EGV65715.1 transcription factor IIIB, Bdp1 subunit [Yamadazyma tenuis ATCC 10573]WEJ95969.1 hypothetical protein PSN45_003503 [Yamadazyma tenuis]